MADFKDTLLNLGETTRKRLEGETKELKNFYKRFNRIGINLRDYLQRLYDIDVLNGFQKGDKTESIFQNIIPRDLLKEFGLPDLSHDSIPSGKDPTSYINDVSEKISQLPQEKLSRFIDKLTAPVSAMSRANMAFEKSQEYYSKVDNRIKQGDAAQTHTVSPCPGVDMSKSPYEIAKREWEKTIVLNAQFQVDQLSGVSGIAESILGDESKPYMNQLAQEFNAYISAGILDEDLFKRDEALPAGTPVVLDFGTDNGTYGEYQKNFDDFEKANLAAGEQKYKSVDEYLNNKVSIFNPPAEIFHLLNTNLDDDGKPLATDGKPLDYDFLGIDPSPNTRKPKLLTPEEKKEISDFMSKKAINSLNEFMTEYKTLKDEHSKKNFLYKMKPIILTNALVAIGGAEIYKLSKVLQEIQKLQSTGVSPNFLDVFHQESHGASLTQGWIEAILNVYKVITNISNGKYGDATRDALFGGLGWIAEFGTKIPAVKDVLTTLFPNLMAAGAGGYVGIALTLFSTIIDYAIRPLVKKSNEKMIDKLLDLERAWLEDQCCQKFHPILYRKTRGQVIIPVVEDTAGNSIDHIKIPIGPGYKKGYDPEYLNGRPCDKPKIEDKQNYIGLYRQSSSLREIDPTQSGNRGIMLPNIDVKVEPYKPQDKSSDKCKKPVSLDGIKVGPTSNLLLHEAIPSWSNQTEKDYQSAIFSYNLNYVANTYLGKIREADCRIGKLNNSDGSGGGGSIEYQNGGKIPLDDRDGDSTLQPVSRTRITYFTRRDNPLELGPVRIKEAWYDYWTGNFSTDLEWINNFKLPTGGIVKPRKPV